LNVIGLYDYGNHGLVLNTCTKF